MEEAIDTTLLSDQERLAPYLIEWGLLGEEEPFELRSLGGGVSNRIVEIVCQDRSFVLKQAQPKLDVKEEWFAPIDRVLIEADCMEALRGLLPPGVVPEVYFVDRERFTYGMESAPAGSILWKKELMEGRIDPSVAGYVGEILAAMHSKTQGNEELRLQFWDNRILHALRIDPCFTFLAGVHPAIGDEIREQAAELDATKLCLVHGDYTPKNMLRADRRLILLDYEIAHWGHPAIDSGFLVAHLLLKAIQFPGRRQQYVSAARAFWVAYVDACTVAPKDDLERSTAKIVPYLVLARIDSKSPVEYITAEQKKELARRFSYDFIRAPSPVLDALFDHLFMLQDKSHPQANSGGPH
jgi:aminoglycoside phosphotransferase (APT) family kinase protein